MNLPKKIDYEAALWVVRLERGLTAAEQDQFRDWFAANPRHGEALVQQKSDWLRLNLLAGLRPLPAAKPNPNLLAPAGRMKHRRVAWFLPLTRSAACLATFFYAKRADHIPPDAPAPATLLIAPIERRALADGSTVLLNRSAEFVVKYTEAERSFIRRTNTTRGIWWPGHLYLKLPFPCPLLLSACVHPVAAAPNVRFIISDDLTATALSCYGNRGCSRFEGSRL